MLRIYSVSRLFKLVSHNKLYFFKINFTGVWKPTFILYSSFLCTQLAVTARLLALPWSAYPFNLYKFNNAKVFFYYQVLTVNFILKQCFMVFFVSFL